SRSRPVQKIPLATDRKRAGGQDVDGRTRTLTRPAIQKALPAVGGIPSHLQRPIQSLVVCAADLQVGSCSDDQLPRPKIPTPTPRHRPVDRQVLCARKNSASKL